MSTAAGKRYASHADAMTSELVVGHPFLQAVARLVLKERSAEGLSGCDARVAGPQPGLDADVADAQDVQRAIILLKDSQRPKTGLLP